MATPEDNVPACLTDGTELGVAAANMYASPAAPGVGTRITKICFVNTSGGAQTIRLWHTPNVAVANRYALAFDITIPGDGWPVDLPAMNGIILDVDDEIWALCSAAASVNIFIYGIEMNP